MTKTKPPSHDELLIERLFSKVVKTDTCWLWTAGKSRGYGQLSVNNKGVYAHRISYEYHNNVRLNKTQLLLHSCDIRACVNPEHLRIGSYLENSTDMVDRGRIANKRADRFYFDPSGVKIQIDNMRKFCRDNNLNRIALIDVERGTRKSYKGYTKYAE